MADILDALYDDGKNNRSEEDYPFDSLLSKTAPLLHDFIRFDRYKGQQRQPGKITITTEGNLWSVTITDPDRQRSFACHGPDVPAALATMDNLIESGQVAWRYWGKKGGGTKRGK